MKGGRAANPSFFNNTKKGFAHEQSFSSTSSLTKKFQQARRDGHLNLSSVKPGLREVPAEVFQLEEFLEDGEKFWEVEPLRSLDISFNAIESIPPGIGNLTTCHTIKARSNKITGPLPVSLFTECVALRILDLSQNELFPTIPNEVGQLQELRDLSLGTNRIVELPQSLFYLPNIRILDLSHNQITELPPGLSCTTLVSLNLSHNRLRSIPSLAALQSLETLHCASNQLQFLPDMSNLIQLKSLDASQNQLSKFPVLPRHQSKLSQLILSYNRLSELNMSILCLQKNLSEFLVHNNALTDISPEIESLQALKVLDISNNDIQDIPATLGYISSLQILKLEGNRIKTIRQTLLQKNCQEIKTYLRTRGPSILNPGETEMDGLAPSSLRKVVTTHDLASNIGLRAGSGSGSTRPTNPSLAAASIAAADAHYRQKLVSNLTFRLRDINGGVLDLSKLQLENRSLTDAVEILASYPSVHTVRTLQLENNLLQYLPYEILVTCEDLFQELQTIRIRGNQLSKGFENLPISQYSELEVLRWNKISGLDIGHNKLTVQMVDRILCTPLDSVDSRSTRSELSPLLWRFPNLAELNLEHNPLGSVPFSLMSPSMNNVFGKLNTDTCRSLQRLQLNGCQLQEVSDLHLNFNYYINLSYVDLSDNRLSLLPDSIQTANKLQFLSIENNEFREIPVVLGLLPSLQTLLIQGNPQRQIRTNVIQQGSVKILQFLRERCAIPIAESSSFTPSAAAAAGNSTTLGIRNVKQSADRRDVERSTKVETSTFDASAAGPPLYSENNYSRHRTSSAVSMNHVRETKGSYYDQGSAQFNRGQSSSTVDVPLVSGSRSSMHSGYERNRPEPFSAHSHRNEVNNPSSVSLGDALRIRQECQPSSVLDRTKIRDSGGSTSSTSLISARVKPRSQQNSSSSGGGRSDPSSYW